ncbi:MAG: LysM peptidoglycan-binding domain-containing protein [Anaerolineae bacterium]|nr:LysM peptidoglycan-binding domain-containing protein [Anaerolineae bacterium]
MKHLIKLLVILGLCICGVRMVMAAPPAQTGGQEYTVQPGDCLARVAERFYGSQQFWPVIWQATNSRAVADSRFTMISNPHLIHSGQILWLPAEVEPLPVEPGSAQTGAASEASGLLTVDIMYIGQWYRETFNYSKDAPNIRHLAVVMPAAQYEANHHLPGHICSSLAFSGANEPLQFRSDLREVNWDLSVLHPVPYRAELEPGRYYVGGCFIAAPLSREEAGVGDDVILYAGITGGGASSDYQVVTIEPGGQHNVTITLTDQDGWACPWVYVFNGQTFERRSEILRNLKSKSLETTQRVPLGAIPVQDGLIRLQIREEKPETTYLDTLYLEVEGTPVWPNAKLPQAGLLAQVDQHYLVLQRGDVFELTFDVSALTSETALVEVMIVSTGYYDF